jgi:hypothetical protein
MPRPAGNPDDKYRGNIFNVIPLVDSRHDFEATSQDTSIQIGRDDAAAQFDCFQNFTNNIQRIVIIGDENPDQRGYSQRLTSSCKGTSVMRGHPEDEFLKFVENKCGIPETPRDFTVATLAAWAGGGGTVISTGWNGENPGATPGPYGLGFRKILISGAELGHGYPSEREIEIALAMRERREPPRKPGRQIVVNPANVDRILAQPDAYSRYHQAIANAIRGDNPDPVPVVVDTTRTLQNKSDPYFIICRNRESVTDPSITSKIQFPIIAREVIEDENLERNGPDYIINGVQHAIKGSLMTPTIRYNIGGDDYEYDFSGEGSKPNEIEVCKGKIKKEVDTIITAAQVSREQVPNYYQNPIAPPAVRGNRVAQLITLFDNSCTIYNRVSYTDKITDEIKRQIALPYIAKRGGDQLQALSCKQNIKYNITNGPKPAGNYNIQNCIFWTIDRVAAIFAVLKGITTVLQLPTKDVIIYKKEDYIPQIVPVVDGGARTRPKPKKRLDKKRVLPVGRPSITRDLLGTLLRNYRLTPRQLRLATAPKRPGEVIQLGFLSRRQCTRAQMKNIISNDENISSSCFLKLIEELCDPNSNYYDAFTLLNMINYHINISIGGDYRNNPINNATFTGELELSLDNCIGIWPDDIIVDGQPVVQPFYGGNDAAGRKYLVHFMAGAQDISIVWRGGLDNTIDINGRAVDLIGINGILPKIGFIDNTKMEFFKYAVSVDDAIQMRNQGGGAESFYDAWASLQKDFNIIKANKLFLQFIELLKLCENQYFIRRDTADNFYVYNPNTYIRVGGYTQIEMMSFVNILINEYKNTKSNSDKHKIFLLAFVYFPFLLQKIGFTIILTDIAEYIRGWFDYENVSIHMPENIADLYSYFITTIIGKALTKIKSIQGTLSPDTSKCANQLFSIFPHGYFNIQYNMLTMGTSGISTNETLSQIINTTVTNSPQSTPNQGNNIQNLINNLSRLTVTQSTPQQSNSTTGKRNNRQSIAPRVEKQKLSNVQSRVTSSVRKRNINKSKKRLTFINNSNLSPSKRKQPVGGKHLTKKRRKNKRKTYKKQKY